MDWYQQLTELIDMRSFSNLWFWIALAVIWSSASHWVLGVPFDIVTRARRHGGQAEQDLQDIVRVNVNRMLIVVRVSGLWLLGIISFVLTALATLGWFYDVEFAQALFLLAFPMSIVGFLSVRTAFKLERTGVTGNELRKILTMHRLVIQMIGAASIFVTAVWGMLQNMSIGVLGG